MSSLITLAFLALSAPQIELVSEAASLQEAVSGNFTDASDDGRFVLISSEQSNVVLGQIDPFDAYDLFLTDRWTGRTQLVTHTGDYVTTPTPVSGSNGTGGVISGDGSVVIFTSSSAGLVPGFNTQSARQAYVYRVATGAITPLTRDSANPLLGANSGITQMAVDQQGTRAVVVTRATNLVQGFVDGGVGDDVFAIDLSSLSVTLVSHRAGVPLTGSNRQVSTVANERVALDDAGLSVAFQSNAEDLVSSFQPPTPGFGRSVYVHDLATSTTTLVSHELSAPAVSAVSGSIFEGMSADGQRLIFKTASTNMVAGQINQAFGDQLYLHERSNGLNTLVSHAVGSATLTANGDLGNVSNISADGGRIVFSHSGEDIMSGITDTNGADDIFLYNIASRAVERLVSFRAGQPLVATSVILSSRVEMSGDGSLLGMNHTGTTWVAGFSHGGLIAEHNSYSYDLVTGVRSLLSRSASSSTTGANDADFVRHVSRDGTTIFRESEAGNLALGSPLEGKTVVANQHPAGTSAFAALSAGAPSASANGESRSNSRSAEFKGRTLSDDGRRLLFFSSATNAAAGTIEGASGTNLYLRDRSDGSVRLINHAGDGVTTTGHVEGAHISGDGNTIVFMASGATEVVPGFLGSATLSAFAYDVATRTCTLISGPWNAPTLESNGNTVVEGTSRDGRYAALSSWSTDLFPNITDANGSWDVFRVDLRSGSRQLITASATMPGMTADDGSRNVSISRDGSYIAFESDARDLVPGFVDNNGSPAGDVFVFDFATASLSLVSHRFGSPVEGADDESMRPIVNHSGSVVFESRASDLIQGFVDRNGLGSDLFQDDGSGGMVLVTADPARPLEGWNSGLNASNGFQTTVVSDDGSTICMSSLATDVVPGFVDTNGPNRADLYVKDLRLGTTRLVSHQFTGPNVGLDTGSYYSSLSSNGKRVLWYAWSDSVLSSPSGLPFESDLFITDVNTGVRVLVTEHLSTSSGRTSGVDDVSFALSGDGSSAYFTARERNFVEDDLNNAIDAFFAFLGRECVGLPVCGTTPNSIGQGAELCITGSEIAAANLLTVSVTELPPQTFGLMVVSMETGFLANPGGSLGNLCINGMSLGRYANAIQFSGSAEFISMDIDLTRIPSGGMLTAASMGSVFAWQYWYRDVVGGAAVSNLSDAWIVTFQ